MSEFDNAQVVVRAMTTQDLGEVLEIERASYPAPWSARAYEYELRYNEMAHYFVARLKVGRQENGNGNGRGGMLERLRRAFSPPPPPPNDAPTMVGYIGYWLMAGEAHISTIAVRPEMRGRGFGELLLAQMLNDAAQHGAHVATLEVRISNTNAQQLYTKYGFEQVGLRKAYYSDNNEDAYIMTTPSLGSADYRQKLERLGTALRLRLNENRSAASHSDRAAS